MADHDGGDATYWRGLYQKAQAELSKVNDQLQVETARIAELQAEVERLTAKCAEHDDERRWAHEAHKTRLKREEERDAELSRMAARIAELQAEVERLHKDADELAAARHAFEDRITVRSAELQTALGRAVATLQGERGCCWGAPICNPALGVKCTPCQRNTRIDAILADPTSAAAGEAWRELVDYVRSGGRVHIVCVDGRHDCNDVSCKQGRALLDKVDALRAQR
jgi:uncharacterized small protein (DUF1192 family)